MKVYAPFLIFFLKEQAALLDRAGTGTTFRQIDKKTLSSWSIPLPPLNEQHRIAAKLDSLLARLACARKELSRIPGLVERSKQAILAAAFSGELTRDWRDLQPDIAHLTSDQKGIDGRVGDLKEIPDSWVWTSVGEIAVVSGGLTKNAKRNVTGHRVPYLRVANVYANELRLDDVAEIGCTEPEFLKTRLQEGDLLIVEGNGSRDQIGRVAIWNGEIEGCSHQNHLIRARLNANVIPKYALFWLLSPEGRSSIERVASSSSGLHTLSISKVEGLPIPMCGLNEQQEIVRQIEGGFARINRLANEAARATALLDRLEQATLAKAFRGDLLGNGQDGQ